MRKGKSIIGLRVLSQADATDLGPVKDLVFDHESDELLALLMSDRDLFGLIDAQIVPWSQVRSIGPDAIMVATAEARINAGDDPRVKAIMDNHTALSGTKIYTTEGQDLGTLADMYIDDASGRVVGYEVSGGFVSDTMSGKRFMPAPREISIGEGVALVPPSVASDLEAQQQNEPGGLHGVAATVGEKVGTAYDATKEKVTDVYGNIATASVEKQKAFVVGKTASRDVVIPNGKTDATTPESVGAVSSTPSEFAPDALTSSVPSDALATTSSTPTAIVPAEETNVTPVSGYVGGSDISSTGEAAEGEVLVRTGEVITAAHADRAESAGVLHQLVLAAGGSVAGDAISAGREKASGLVASGSSAAGTAGAGMSERAADAALGKPAGREVTAPDGSTIVAPGMIITQEILEVARIHGKEKEVIASAGVGVAAQGADTVRDHAGGLWDTVKQKAAELTGAAHDKKAEYDAQAEQSRINNALGRPTTRVILDQSDNVILNTGDLITHAAIEQARTADVLEILLDSVYTADPEITPEMLRAKEPGQAALETQAQPTGGPITATVAPGSNQPAQDTPPQGALPQT